MLQFGAEVQFGAAAVIKLNFVIFIFMKRACCVPLLECWLLFIIY